VLGCVKDEASAREFRKVLTQCFCNLIPMRDSDDEMPKHKAFGYYIRCKDKRRRDGEFVGPVHGPDGRRSMRGAAEFKNRRKPVGQSQLTKFVKKLASGEHNLLLFMAPELGEFKAENILPTGGGTTWLVLHWTMDTTKYSEWHTEVSGGEAECKRHRILILMEIGLSTKPFSEPSMLQDEMDDEDP